MVLIKLFLFYFSIEISKHLVSCGPDDVDSQEISNNLTFDLRTLKVTDYTINELNDPILSYKFIPKTPKIISDVKINDTLVWEKNDQETIANIVVYVTNKKPHTYELNITDSNSVVNSIHFDCFTDLKSIGVIDFLHSKSTNLIQTYNQDFFIFNLKNPFDYKYHKTQRLISGDSTSENIIVNPRVGYFIDIYDDMNKVTTIDKSIEKIKLSIKNKVNVLLKLSIKDEPESTLMFYKYEEDQWKLSNQEEYNNMYTTNEFNLATSTQDLGIHGPLVNYDISDTKTLVNTDIKVLYSNFMLIPTIIYQFVKLQILNESNIPILSGDLNNASVYIFRNPQGFEMIEIVHNSSGENKTRSPNYYFIKDNGEWKVAKQINVIQKINEEAVLKLREKGAPEDLLQKIQNLYLSATDAEVEKTNLDLKETFTLPNIKSPDDPKGPLNGDDNPPPPPHLPGDPKGPPTHLPGNNVPPLVPDGLKRPLGPGNPKGPLNGGGNTPPAPHLPGDPRQTPLDTGNTPPAPHVPGSTIPPLVQDDSKKPPHMRSTVLNKDEKDDNKVKKKSRFYISSIPIVSLFLFYIIY